MHSFWIIFKQAFLTKATTKSFIITTVIVCASFFLLANMSKILDVFQGEDEDHVLYIVDESGELAPRLQEQLQLADRDIQAVPTEQTEKELKEGIVADTVEAYLVLEQGEELTARYVTKSANELENGSNIEQAVQSLQTILTAEKLNLDNNQVEQLFAPALFEREAVSESSKSQEELSQARGLVYILIMLIYISVIYYPNMIAMEVATEKSSRVMEILISSVSPVKHMFAKIAGIGTLGILQMLAFGLSGFIAIKTAGTSMTEGIYSVFGFADVKISTFLFAVLFFLLGYFLYAVLAALLGSLVSRTEDVQQLMLPMMLLIIVASLIAFSGISVPEANFVTIASFIPFFAPLVMFLRVGMLDVPLWEPLLSIAIMLVTIGLLGWLGARVYRGGVLMYGSAQSLKDIRKAIALGNKK
ncbi:ABC-2 type transport system permease protein [Planomicrobium soli]|uniref:ABC-2 type transport system permease protein n=1 Tax=Planomicrobium soli TaxID=1176648 RepID=A0A2P8G9H3_9BACL|nr:ABC transporter permease [Planomicrobium soli]PSL30621.1 ABC-2 type transport system permease protein [Planomicrobium soli]